MRKTWNRTKTSLIPTRADDGCALSVARDVSNVNMA